MFPTVAAFDVCAAGAAPGVAPGRGCRGKRLRLPCLERKRLQVSRGLSILLAMRLTDKFGRAITDLRLAITDRCNYKCVYCRTGQQGAMYAELPFSDYLRMTRVFVSLGIAKIRITG